jgi:Ca2+-transporting ATPase
MGIGAFLIFNWAQARMSIEEARTLTFCTLVTFEWFRAFNARSDELTVFKIGVFRNKWLALSVSAAVLLQMAVIYVPFLQEAFRTVPLSLSEWGIVISAGGSLFIAEEARKYFFPRLFSRGKWQPAGKKGEEVRSTA